MLGAVPQVWGEKKTTNQPDLWIPVIAAGF